MAAPRAEGSLIYSALENTAVCADSSNDISGELRGRQSLDGLGWLADKRAVEM
jgi:hypothetical protein